MWVKKLFQQLRDCFMTSSTKRFLYRLFNMILKWSLVYMIVLFFLEDVKPFLVSTVFMPHWVLFVLLISLTGVLWLAPFGHEKNSNTTKKIINLTNFDIWLFRVILWVLLAFWLPMAWSAFGFFGILLMLIFALLSEKFTILLVKKF